MAVKSLLSMFSNDLAIDLGTANTLVYAKNKGIVVREPSIVAVNKITNNVEAVGKEAKEMLGRTPGNIVAIRPMKDGVIADFEVTEKMLEYFIKKAHGRTLPGEAAHRHLASPRRSRRSRSAPCKDSALRAGATEVYLIEQAMAAAIGAGLPITDPTGNMIVDIGGGTTDVAVISLAGIVYSRSVRVAGNEMDDAIIQYIKRKYNLLIGERTAEQIKMEIGSAFPLDEEMTMEIKGRDLVEGVPKTLVVTDEEIREALSETGGHDRRGGARGARAHAARALRRHHGQGHHHRRRRLDAEEPRQAPARRDRPAGDARRGPARLRRARHGADADGLQSAAEDLDRIDGREAEALRLRGRSPDTLPQPQARAPLLA